MYMKKVLSIFFVLIFCSVSAVTAETKSEYLIDKVLNECTSKNFMTSGMNRCTYEGIDAWNKEITKYSAQIIGLLNDDEVEIFNVSQQSWENYYNKEKDFLYKTIYQKEGDIHTTFAISDMYDLVKSRALTLKKYLSELTEY